MTTLLLMIAGKRGMRGRDIPLWFVSLVGLASLLRIAALT